MATPDAPIVLGTEAAIRAYLLKQVAPPSTSPLVELRDRIGEYLSQYSGSGPSITMGVLAQNAILQYELGKANEVQVRAMLAHCISSLIELTNASFVRMTIGGAPVSLRDEAEAKEWAISQLLRARPALRPKGWNNREHFEQRGPRPDFISRPSFRFGSGSSATDRAVDNALLNAIQEEIYSRIAEGDRIGWSGSLPSPYPPARLAIAQFTAQGGPKDLMPPMWQSHYPDPSIPTTEILVALLDYSPWLDVSPPLVVRAKLKWSQQDAWESLPTKTII
ncbi:MAG: hypothetical protein U0821_18695 [Chloroflexota bacterium]